MHETINVNKLINVAGFKIKVNGVSAAAVGETVSFAVGDGLGATLGI
jgi:hypothetical protein